MSYSISHDKGNLVKYNSTTIEIGAIKMQVIIYPMIYANYVTYSIETQFQCLIMVLLISLQIQIVNYIQRTAGLCYPIFSTYRLNLFEIPIILTETEPNIYGCYCLFDNSYRAKWKRGCGGGKKEGEGRGALKLHNCTHLLHNLLMHRLWTVKRKIEYGCRNWVTS